MKKFKSVMALMLSAVFVALCFAGCSSAEIAEEITDETLIVAYTEEKAPFIYKDKDGKLAGFDVELMGKIFKDVKNDFKNYKFVQVDENYRLGEDAAYTDENGKNYIAYVMVGGVAKDSGSFNKSHTFTKNIIDNRIVTITAKDSKITSYADLSGVKAGVVSEGAKAALDKNAVIKNAMKSVKDYKTAKEALEDLKSGKLDAVVIDEFNFNVTDEKGNFKVLDGELDIVSYVYSFKKWDWYDEAFNKAIYELKSPEYNDKDEFTPIVEKYFGYNASSFDFVPSDTK